MCIVGDGWNAQGGAVVALGELVSNKRSDSKRLQV